MNITLKSDGRVSPNPGFGGFGAVARLSSGQTLERKGALGYATSNGAEYLGLIHGLRIVREHTDACNAKYVEVSLTVVGDSKLVIDQMKNKAAVNNPNLALLHEIATALATSFPGVEYRHCRREDNLVTDRLANLAREDVWCHIGKELILLPRAN